MKTLIYSALLLLTISAFAQAPEVVTQPAEPTCDDKLHEYIKGLVAKDHNGILSLQYQLTMLQLAKKVVGSQSSSLEEYIKKDMARLNALDKQDPATLADLDRLYDSNASDHLKAVYQNINSLKQSAAGLNYIANKRIENDDVSSYILYESLLDKNDNTFSKRDVAIIWMMKNLKDKAARNSGEAKASVAEVSDQIARYTGLIKGTSKSSVSDITKELNAIKRKIDLFMIDAKKALYAANPQCVDDKKAWIKSVCSPINESEELSELMLSMTDVSNSVARNVVGQITARTKDISRAPAGREELNACEGKPFKDKELSASRWELGVPDKHGMHHAEEAAAKLLFSAGEIPMGPFIKCGKHIKKKLLQIDFYKKETCCSNKITPYNENKVLASLELDLFCKGFVGIPYFAEAGIKGGIQFEGGVGGKSSIDKEKNCEPKLCVYGKAAVRPYLALYLDALAGGATIEGGIRMEPYATFGYCAPKANAAHGHLTAEFVPNKLYLYYQGSLGWGMVLKSGSYKLAEIGEPIDLLGH
ncbi:MAG: hypothetical protein K2P81_02755 [Bacteriovoracaceae bacterium]|nr:hypothetical protein [Bacteriovoracaceae bacterium]